MTVTSGFFNSLNGDRKYNAEQINEFFGSLISSGVLPTPSTSLQVIAKNDMTVQVKPGKGFINSHWVKNDAILELTLDTADSMLQRWDAIIMKLDESTSGRQITIEVKKGTPASAPQVPSMTRSETIQEYCLARVLVGKAVTSITQSDITDTRANNNVCGWVTGLITQVDTSTLFDQWEAAYSESIEAMENWQEAKQANFESWLETLTSQLTVGAYIKKYQKIIDTGATSISLDMSGYSYDSNDVIFVLVNGFVLTESVDYQINTQSLQIMLNTEVESGNNISIVVLKSKLGSA